MATPTPIRVIGSSPNSCSFVVDTGKRKPLRMFTTQLNLCDDVQRE